MLVQRRRPLFDRNALPALHWASVYVAREHRREDGDWWTCQCVECDRVRAELSRNGMVPVLRTAANGGAK